MSETNKNEYVKPVVVASFKDLNFDGPVLQMDLDEDAWSYGAPPPLGVYEVKWFPAKDGFKIGYGIKDNPNTMYAIVETEGRIVNNKDWDDTFVPGRVTSQIFKGKKISHMAGMLVAGNQKSVLDKLMKEGKLTPKLMAQLLEKLLKSEPIIRAEIDWKGSYSYPNPANPQEKLWENIYNKYSDFPEDPEDKSQRLHVCQVVGVDKQEHEVRAQLKVNRYLHKGEAYNPAKQSASVKPIAVAQPIKIEEDATPSPTLVSQPKPVAVSQPVVESPVGTEDENDSIALMLAD